MSHGKTFSIKVLAPHSRLYQGPFGRICADLAPWHPAGVSDDAIDDFLFMVADEHMLEVPGRTPGDIVGDEGDLDQNFRSNIPAGYTYFGQFIDHDITFDPISSLMRRNDPNALLNFRTPRLDLDNVYGRGPEDQPYLYDQDNPGKMLIGKIADSDLDDLPRNTQGTALIGDKRNDENAIVSQLQLAFLRAHNTLVDNARDNSAEDPFESARQTLRWLYQFVAWNDFVKRITDEDVFNCALKQETDGCGRTIWDLGLTDVYNWHDRPFMPVEFSVAAYRLGHSMVRNAYQTNIVRGFGQFAPIFDNAVPGANPDDLRGFRPMTKENAIQWDWFLQMTSSQGPFPQMTRKLDTKLSNALAFLHEDEAGSRMNVLAFRNLKRSWTFGLPSGTDVATKFGVAPIQLGRGEPDALWFYILKEAAEAGGNKLGKVGSLIVAATFAGLLKGDPSSYFNINPTWTPDQDPNLQGHNYNRDDPSWTLASVIRIAGVPVEAGDF